MESALPTLATAQDFIKTLILSTVLAAQKSGSPWLASVFGEDLRVEKQAEI